MTEKLYKKHLASLRKRYKVVEIECVYYLTIDNIFSQNDIIQIFNPLSGEFCDFKTNSKSEKEMIEIRDKLIEMNSGIISFIALDSGSSPPVKVCNFSSNLFILLINSSSMSLHIISFKNSGANII
jgi:hypothetical protein